LTRRRGATAFVARLQRGTPELNGQIPCSNQVWDLFARLSHFLPRVSPSSISASASCSRKLIALTLVSLSVNCSLM
jgi:hypothetical protein